MGLESLIENLSEALVLADPGDRSLLQKAHSHILDISTIAESSGMPQLAAWSAAAADMLHQVLRGEAANPSAALDVVTRAATAFQSIICENVAPADAKVPDELMTGPRHAADRGIPPPPTGLPPAIQDASGLPRPRIVTPPQVSAPDKQSVPASRAARAVVSPPPPAAEVDFDLLEAFITECHEHLDAAEVCLLNLHTKPNNAEDLNAVFRAFHTIKGAAAFMNLEEFRTVAHETENLLDLLRGGRLPASQQTTDIVFAATDILKRMVNALQPVVKTRRLPDRDPQVPAFCDRVRLFLDQQRAGVPTATVQAPAPKQPVPEDRDASFHGDDVHYQNSVRVSAERLDRLLDAIGELVIAEAMVSQSTENGSGDPAEMDRRLRHLDKITRTLQQMSTSLRMIPIRPAFVRMSRLVRDLARKSGKPIHFSMSGEDTELDKAVVDRIVDPLVHLLRNAVDHGIEDGPAARRSAGKPETARIELRAFHRGGNIHIEVEDDGRGFNRAAILERAREKGLIRDGDNLPDREVYELVFEPGFSTAQTVTEISGRGVGMDVVKRYMQSLRGQIEVESAEGRGTTISLRVPLTLAIIDAMTVGVGAEKYVIPTLSIQRCIRPARSDVSTIIERGEVISVGGQQVPLFRLARLFGIADARQDPSSALAVIADDNGRQVGLLVDELFGQQQIVIKGIGDFLNHAPGIAGGAIMANGLVGLILDIPGLVRMAHAGVGACENSAAKQADTVEAAEGAE